MKTLDDNELQMILGGVRRAADPPPSPPVSPETAGCAVGGALGAWGGGLPGGAAGCILGGALANAINDPKDGDKKLQAVSGMGTV